MPDLPLILTGAYTNYAFHPTRQLNPPPPNPPINIILLLGPRDITYTIANNFSQSFKYRHLDVISRLYRLNKTRDVAKMGSLHPLALREGLKPGGKVSGRLCVPIMKEMIDEEVARGERSFVISGVEGSKWVFEAFEQEIASPNAFVFLYQPGDFFDQARKHIEQDLGDRVVMVPFTQDIDDTYALLLDALGRKAMSEQMLKRDHRPPVEIIDITMEDDEEEDLELTRVDSPMGMLAAANAALRRK